MNQNHRRSVLATSSAAAIAALLLAPTAHAAAASSSTSAGTIEELIVTAEKRSESQQTVPVAISAYNEKMLQARGIVSVDDLKFQVPNLTVYSYGPGVTNYSIRGLGNSNNRSANVDGSVGIFVNEVYIGRPFLANTDFLDISQVEVLRGPQGSLFGRNTIGGAISFTSSPATRDLKAQGQVTAGNYGLISAGGVVSGPITDSLSGKLAATTRFHDGYDFNTTTNHGIEDEQFGGISGQLRYTPTDNLDVALNLDSSRRRGTGDWWIIQTEGPLTGRAYADPRRGNGAPDNGFGNIDNTGGSLNANWKTPIGTLTSITSYREGRLDSRTPSTGTNPALLTDTAAVKAKLSDILFTQEDDYRGYQQSQELRLASNGDGPLKWILGGFYYHESMEHTRITDFRFVKFFFQGSGRFDAKGNTTAYAVFGNLSYNITDDLKVTAGLRWSQDTKHSVEVPSGTSYGSAFKINGVAAPGGFLADASKTFSDVSPTVTVNYQINPSAMVYARVARGFKSGGFNDIQTEKVDAQTAFNPETVVSYEAGLKSEWMDHRARLNLSVFRLNYNDLQVGIIIPGATAASPNIIVTGNAGKTYNQGVEAEWEVIATEHLNIYGNLTVQKSRIEELVVSGASLAGNELPRIPKTQFLIGAAYTQPFGKFDTTTRISYNKTGSQFANTNDLAIEKIPEASNLNASFVLEPHDGIWSVELWGKNLEDKLNITSLAAIFNTSYAHLGTPKTYGVTFRAHY